MDSKRFFKHLPKILAGAAELINLDPAKAQQINPKAWETSTITDAYQNIVESIKLKKGKQLQFENSDPHAHDFTPYNPYAYSDMCINLHRDLSRHLAETEQLIAELCKKNPEAKYGGGEIFTSELFARLQEVNIYINKSTMGVTDKEQFGVDDKWVPGYVDRGDCEEFAMQKFLMLIRGDVDKKGTKSKFAKLNPNNFTFLVVNYPRLNQQTGKIENEGHLLLLVKVAFPEIDAKTGKLTFVRRQIALDNMRDKIMLFEDSALEQVYGRDLYTPVAGLKISDKDYTVNGQGWKKATLTNAD